MQDFELFADIRPPEYAGNSLAREGLIEQELEADTTRAVLVFAPAGYGKTTLLAQHYHASVANDAQCGWLSFDDDLQSPVEIARHIIASLEPDASGAERPASASFLGGASRRELAHAILRSLSASAPRSLLYLDDLHALTDASALQMLDTVIRRLPKGAAVVMASRTRPALSLAQYAANGWLREIGVEALRLRTPEARAVFGDDLPGELIERVVETTEGWPAGLHLYSLMSEELKDSLPPAVSSPAGAAQPGRRLAIISDYLTEQVFGELDPGTRELLLKTSILRRFNWRTVNDVAGVDDAWERLQELARRGFFIFAADSERRWYRHHQLFRAFLFERLRVSVGEAGIARLRRLAAESLLAQGHGNDAVRQAFGTGDLSIAEDVARRMGGWRVAFLTGSDVWSRLDAYSAEDLLPYPTLSLAAAHRFLAKGDIAEARRFFDAWRDGAAGAVPDDSPLLRIDAPLIDLLIAWHEDRPHTLPDFAQFIASAEREPGLDRRIVIAIHELSAWLCYWHGDFAGSVGAAARSAQRSSEISIPMIEYFAWTITGASLGMLGRFPEAIEALEAARTIVASHIGADSDYAVIPDAFRADILLEQGDLSAAAACNEPALGAIGAVDTFTDFVYTTCRVASWRMLERTGLAQALSVIEQTAAALAELDLPLLRKLLRIQRIRLALAAEDAALAAELAQDSALAELTDPGYCSQPVNWRGALPALIVAARLARAAGDGDLMRRRLDSLTRLVSAIGAVRFEPELRLLEAACARLRRDAGETRERLAEAVRSAAKTNQRFVYREERSWVEPLLGQLLDDPGTGWTDEERGWASGLVGGEPAKDRGSTAPRVPEGLSPREAQVFRFLCDGFTSKEVARELGIAVNTAMSYRKSLYRKLGASRRSQLVAIAKDLSTRTGA